MARLKTKECIYTCANVQIQRETIITDSSMAVVTILDNNAVNWRVIRIALDEHGQDRTTVAVVQIAFDSLPIWTHLCILTLQDGDVGDWVQQDIAAHSRRRQVGEVDVNKAAPRILVKVLGDLSVARDGAIVLLASSNLDI
jgi:hypothetical protein